MESQVEKEYDVQMLTAKDVAKILNVPVSRGYTIIRMMNKELAASGKLILRGRINKSYFYRKLIP